VVALERLEERPAVSQTLRLSSSSRWAGDDGRTQRTIPAPRQRDGRSRAAGAGVVRRAGLL